MVVLHGISDIESGPEEEDAEGGCDP